MSFFNLIFFQPQLFTRFNWSTWTSHDIIFFHYYFRVQVGTTTSMVSTLWVWVSSESTSTNKNTTKTQRWWRRRWQRFLPNWWRCHLTYDIDMLSSQDLNLLIDVTSWTFRSPAEEGVHNNAHTLWFQRFHSRCSGLKNTRSNHTG